MIDKFIKFPYGFMFSDETRDNIPAYYKKEHVLGKYYYYYEDRLSLNLTFDSNDFLIIHGHFTFAKTLEDSSNEIVLKHLFKVYKESYSTFLDELDFLGGRYVVICGNKEEVEFYPDATCSRTVYYSTDYNIVSSHVHFINETKMHILEEKFLDFKDMGIVWDLTPYKNIKSLSANVKLEFYKKEKYRFFPRANNKYNDLDKSEKVKYIGELWNLQIETLMNQFDKVVSSITGGSDSRVNLSLLKDKIDSIEFFTYITKEQDENDKNKRLMMADEKRVREMLEDIPLHHHFIYKEDNIGKLTEKENTMIQKNTVRSHNKNMVYGYNKLFPEENVLHLRSNINEIGKGVLINKKTKNTPEKVKSYFVNRYNRVYKQNVKDNSINIEEIAESGLKAFRLHDDVYDFHRMELYYWEFVMGRWLPEILNETDVSFETITPFNLRVILEIALSFNIEDKHSDVLSSELINENYPILNFYGKNKETNLYEDYKVLSKKLSRNPDSLKELKQYSMKSSEKIYEKIKRLEKKIDTKDMNIASDMEKIISMNLKNINNMYKGIDNTENKDEASFYEFVIVDKYQKHRVEMIEKNTLYIDTSISNTIVYSEAYYYFNHNKGALKLILGGYSHKDIKADYEIFVNNKKLLIQNLNEWSQENNIYIYNLNIDDKITVRLNADVSDSMSYFQSPKLKIITLKEISLGKEQSKNITATSASSKLLN